MDDRPDWFEALADRYRVEKEIGRGGMARVYLAEDLRFHRKVAIKVLREELALALAEDRFVEEVRLAGRLNHPNIVPLYDAGVIPAAGGRPALPWFAMMYIAGETLRERLARGPLPVGDAVDIARAVATALDYAHDLKVIHRDIKPANILLAGNVPVVADFGIARALDRAGGVDTLTAPGLAVGTAQYISPEQAGSEPTVDHRTDVYALGCVVYEMLAGHPPFTGPTAQAIIARHNLDLPPPLATVRPTVPPAAVEAVERALAKRAEDRWPSAGAFAHALRETTEHAAVTGRIPAWRRRWWTRRRTGVAALALTVVTVGAGYLLADGNGGGSGSAADTTRYAVFPFLYEDEGIPRLAEEEVLRDALDRWGGLTVEDPFRVRDQLRRRGRTAPRDGDEALRIARDMGVGRYYQGTIGRIGDSLRVHATAYDVATRRALRSKEIRVPAGSGRLDAALRALADTLLLQDVHATDGTGAYPGAGRSFGTASLPALQAFATGKRAIDAWNLAAADTAFSTALEFGPDFPQAATWLALVRTWSDQPPARWEWAARIAADAAERLDGRDSVVVAALQARAVDDMVTACRLWAGLTQARARDFVGWYGSGDCQRADRVVVRYAPSPSGWRFRSSYHAALAAFRRALELHPAVHRGFRDNTYASLNELFLTSPLGYRDGRTGPGGRRIEFYGIPVWEADTLLIVPVPMESEGSTPAYVSARRRREALEHLRGEFFEIARGWAAAFPRSPEALEAYAFGMALIGDPTAADTLARARLLARGSRLDLELAGEEVWLRLRLGASRDLRAIRRAADLADSLLALPGLDGAAPGLAAGLAALTGKSGRLYRLAATGVLDPEWGPPAHLRQVGPSLWAFAALPLVPDSTTAYAGRVRDAITRSPRSVDRARLVSGWLGRAVMMAFPEQVLSAVLPLVENEWYLLGAIAAHARGDTTGVRSALAGKPRHPDDPETLGISVDLLPAEAALRWLAGDSAIAVGMLQVSLAELEVLGSGKVSDPLYAAGVGRALALWAAMDRIRAPGRVGFAEEAARVLWARADRPVAEVILAYQALLE